MNYYGKHTSMSQWVKAAKLSWADDLIAEDATKRERLELLQGTFGLPVTPSFTFKYEQVVSPDKEYESFLQRVSPDQRYALRLNPTASGMEVVRNRNMPVVSLVDWASGLGIDLRMYEFTFEPHVVSEKAAILVVSEDAASGEAANGSILDLNSGTNPAVRSYVFKAGQRLEVESGCPADLSAFINRVLDSMKVPSQTDRARLSELLDVSFFNDMACGYYEAISDPNGLISFIDFNRVLETPLSLMVRVADQSRNTGQLALNGQCGCPGRASGRARLVLPGSSFSPEDIEPGDVLICRHTEPEHIQLINRASAVVTDLGGVLSHAAIVARELGKPCVVGTRTATTDIHNGDEVEVRASEGLVLVANAAATET